MRVQLPTSPSPPPPLPQVNPRPAEATPPIEAPQSRPDKGHRFLVCVTHWSVALPVLLLCGAALGWSFFFRLADAQRLLKVHARGTPLAETNRLVTLDELSVMRREVRERSAVLIRERKEIPPLLSKLDAKARELGWRCEASLKPVVTAPGGVQELAAHPVVIELRYEYVQPERAYAALLAWLWTVSTLQPRAEVTSLKLQSLGHGLNGAQVELTFFTRNAEREGRKE